MKRKEVWFMQKIIIRRPTTKKNRQKGMRLYEEAILKMEFACEHCLDDEGKLTPAGSELSYEAFVMTNEAARCLGFRDVAALNNWARKHKPANT
jgi:hypothetical protein